MSVVPISDDVQLETLPDDETAIYDRLTLQQKRFIEAYLGEAQGVGYKAAMLAGYGNDRNSTRSIASRLLRHPSIAACVRARVRETMSEQETISQLARVIRADTADIALNAKVKAIELMMRYHGVLIDKHEMSGTIEQQVKQVVITYAVPPNSDTES